MHIGTPARMRSHQLAYNKMMAMIALKITEPKKYAVEVIKIQPFY